MAMTFYIAEFGKNGKKLSFWSRNDQIGDLDFPLRKIIQNPATATVAFRLTKCLNHESN